MWNGTFILSSDIFSDWNVSKNQNEGRDFELISSTDKGCLVFLFTLDNVNSLKADEQSQLTKHSAVRTTETELMNLVQYYRMSFTVFSFCMRSCFRGQGGLYLCIDVPSEGIHFRLLFSLALHKKPDPVIILIAFHQYVFVKP